MKQKELSMEAERLFASSADWTLSDQEFGYFKQLIYDIAGISLSDKKKELVKSRLISYIQGLQLQSFEGYLQFLQKLPGESHYWQEFVNLLTTNKTDFFREPKHFDYIINTVIPAWLKTGEKVMKVWSCASSSGEEPYTLAMVLKKHLPANKDFEILATDIDTDILNHAKNGVYAMTKFEEIPEEYRKDSVSVGTGDVSNWFRIKSSLKEKVTFQQHNLMEEADVENRTFDLVFCRNVLIYFSRETISRVVQNLENKTKESGLLFIGHSESLQGTESKWKTIQPSVYKLNPVKGK
jgi:chemotaxis protein methyltransferase CheR